MVEFYYAISCLAFFTLLAILLPVVEAVRIRVRK